MLKSLLLSLLLVTALGGQPDQKIQDAIYADAVTDTAGHDYLTRLCDDFGGRLTGSPENWAAMERTVAELKALGIEARLEKYRMPGWVRGNDEVTLLAPVTRRLRAAALSYTNPHEPFEAEVVDIGDGREEDIAKLTAPAGKIGLLSPHTSVPRGQYEKAAVKAGMKAILWINRVNGGQLLARTGSFQGEPLKIPMYNITQEEGFWLRRLIARGQTLKVRLHTRSYCQEVETANIVATFPGRTADTIIVGAHFDSWDLGQGAMDNGTGTAQVFAIAKVLKEHSPVNERTIEFVWFNGEEQGLWGSRVHAPTLKDRPVAAAINLDMVGFPVSVNSVGYDDLVPVLERYNESLGEKKLKQGVTNICWFGSDHTPYQLEGIRAITFAGVIPPESVRYYHDLADTIDKVEPKLISESTAAIATLVYRLANEPGLTTARVSAADTEALFRKFDLQKRMQGVSLWPFAETNR